MGKDGSAARSAYMVLVGMDYKTPKGERRAEPGDVRDDLPERSLPWLLEHGAVRAVESEG
jgi:hypothetical protein